MGTEMAELLGTWIHAVNPRINLLFGYLGMIFATHCSLWGWLMTILCVATSTSLS